MLCKKHIILLFRFPHIRSFISKHGLASSLIDDSKFGDHRALVVEEYGEPIETVKLKITPAHQILPKTLEKGQILVKNLLSCINPADINVIQGIYGKRPKLPAIIGNEGVVRVEATGPNVEDLQPGDIAVGVDTMGYWQSYSVRNSQEFFKIDNDINLTTAAQIKVNPCTAYRMIKDFTNLKQGDVIIQNGANSAVGVYVIQLAKAWGYRTINVIRDRPGKEELVKELKDFGADIIVTETDLTNADYMKPILKEIGKPKLNFNCIGGKNAMNCQRLLENGAYSVTYGAMSKQPFNLSAGSLIFKDHKFVGFWVSRWYEQRLRMNQRNEIQVMLDDIQDMFKKGCLKPKCSTLLSFEDRNKAFSQSNNTKYMFSINE